MLCLSNKNRTAISCDCMRGCQYVGKIGKGDSGSLKKTPVGVQLERAPNHPRPSTCKSIKTKKTRKCGHSQTSVFVFTYFKLITTARRQMIMKGIAGKTARVERGIRINMIDRVGKRLIKTIKTFNGGVIQVRG